MAATGYVLYKRCVEGDRQKVKAASNLDATMGGGARDLRFNPWDKFEAVVADMFDNSRELKDGRKVYSVPVYWWEGDRQGPVEVEFWSPTKSRATEGRLARVHEVTPFDEIHLPEAGLDPFFVLWKDTERAWARYVTVDEFRDPEWPKSFAEPILRSVEVVPAERNIRGWFDARTGRGEHIDGS
jgi:hypothetical protein